MSTPLGSIDPNRIQLNRQAREIYQAEQARQEAAAKAEIARIRQEEERKRQQEQNTPRNRNIVFVPGKGFEFIVRPTYEDPTGSRPVTKEEINPAFFQTPEGQQLAAHFDEMEQQSIAETRAMQEKELFAPGSDNPANVFNLARQGIYSARYTQDERGLYTGVEYRVPVPVTRSADVRYAVDDPRARQQVYYEAAQNVVSRLQQSGGGTVTSEAIEQEVQFLLGTKYQEGIPVSRTADISEFYQANFSSAAFQAQFEESDKERRKREAEERQRMRQEMYDLGYGGETISIDAKGNRTYHFVPRVGRPQYEYVSDPMNPFNIQKVEVAGQEQIFSKPTTSQIRPNDRAGIGDFGYDFAEGYKSYFANLGKVPEAAIAATQGRTVQFAPEAEGEFFSAVAKAPIDFFTGKPVTIAQDLGELGRRMSESPYYYAGSLFATGAFTVATRGASPLLGEGARGGITLLQRLRPSQAQEVAETIGRIRGLDDITIQALGKGEKPLASTRFGVYTKSTPAKLLLPELKVEGEAATVGLKRLELPSKAEQILIRAGKEPAEEIGVILPKQGEVKVVSHPLSQKEKMFEMGTELVDPKTGIGPPKPVPRQLEPGQVLAKGVEDVFPEGLTGGKASELGGTKQELFDYVQDVFTGSKEPKGTISAAEAVGTPTTNIREPKIPFIKYTLKPDLIRIKGEDPIGSIITYDIKAVKKAAKAGAKREKQIGDASKALSELPRQSKPSSPIKVSVPSVVLETVKKSAGAPIKVDVKPVKINTVSAAATAARAAKDAGLVGSNMGLGLGGGVWPKVIGDVETVFLTTPQRAQAPSMGVGQNIDKLLTGGTIEGPAIKVDSIEGLLPKDTSSIKIDLNLDVAPKQRTSQMSLIDTTTKMQTIDLVIPKQTPRLTPGLVIPTSTPRLTPGLVIPTPTRPPPPPRRTPPAIPPIRPLGLEKRKRRKKFLDIGGTSKGIGLGVKSVFSPRGRLGTFDILPEDKRARKRFLRL